MRFRHAFRIVGPNARALGLQMRNDDEAGRVAHVVCVRFEGEAQHGDGLAGNTAESRFDLFGHINLALVVHRDHGLDNARRRADFLGGFQQRQRVLGKTGAAETRAGMQKLVADAAIQPHAARHVLNIRADFFADIRHLVDERDLGRQKCVRCIFDKLAALTRRKQDRRLVEIKRAIDFRQHIARAIRIAAHHHAVGAAEVLDGRAFAQEFGIGNNVALRVWPRLADHLFHFPAAPYGDGGFGDHDGVAVHGLGDLFGGSKYEAEIGVPVAPAAGRSHRDKDGVSVLYGLREGLREGKPSRLHIGGNDLVQPRLEDRNLAGFQARDLAGVLVDTDHMVAEFREAGA